MLGVTISEPLPLPSHTLHQNPGVFKTPVILYSRCIPGYGIGFICIIPVIFEPIHFDTMELKSKPFLVNWSEINQIR